MTITCKIFPVKYVFQGDTIYVEQNVQCNSKTLEKGYLSLIYKGTAVEGLHPPICGWGRKAWNPVCHHGSIAPLEEDSQSRPGVANCLSFLLAIVPG